MTAKRGAAVLLVAALVAYLVGWPVPVQPVAWTAPVSPGYVGAHAPNTRLAALQYVDLGGEEGPEHVALGPEGRLYLAMASGRILRMAPDGGPPEVYADTGGRVLGFDFDAAGRLIAADALKGLLAIGPDGRVDLLVGDLGYADAVVVATDGTLYFTDASTRFPAARWGGTFDASVYDLIEQSASGRVLAHDPRSGRTHVVARGLSFANGIALSADESTLFVVETGRYRVWRIPRAARDLDVRSGAGASVLLDNLPGYPDNLVRGDDGRLWLGLVKPRSATLDRLARMPFLRKVSLRLPRALWPVPPAYGHVLAFDESGRIVADLQDPSGAYPETTGVTETTDRLYVQSLHATRLGWLPKTVLASGTTP